MSTDLVSGFRIVQPQWAATAMDGEGARLYGGRWNPVGIPVVYLAESRSLAALEMLAHLTPKSRRLRFSLIEVSFPKSCIEDLAPSALPENWQDDQAPDSLKLIGAEWVKSESSVVLRVPSAIVPAESNLLLNSRHTDFTKLRMSTPEDWQFDHRL